jgi:hypothetical protein
VWPYDRRMRSQTSAALVVVLAVALVACSSPVATPPDQAPATEEQVPWPEGGSPDFHMVSAKIAEYCPNGGEFLFGESILSAIPVEAFDELEGFACVFTAPASGALDEADEIAYRVDSGLGDLIRAYATTVNYIDGECPDPVDTIVRYPFIWVEYDNAGYTLTAAGCRYTAALDEALGALRVTEVARATETFPG